MPTAIRDAHPDEAAALSRLALRSKAHWGYDAAFLAACEEALTLTAEQIESDDLVVRVAEDPQGARLGMAAVGLVAKELDMLFVEPRAIGTGIGRELVRDALAQAAARGVEELTIEADPGAEPFYRAQGAERIGERISTATGRSLPLLRIVTSSATLAGRMAPPNPRPRGRSGRPGTQRASAKAPETDDHDPGACTACRATGKLTSNKGGTPHEVRCPWCEGSGRFIAEHDAQAVGPQA